MYILIYIHTYTSIYMYVYVFVCIHDKCQLSLTVHALKMPVCLL